MGMYEKLNENIYLPVTVQTKGITKQCSIYWDENNVGSVATSEKNQIVLAKLRQIEGARQPGGLSISPYEGKKSTVQQNPVTGMQLDGREGG